MADGIVVRTEDREVVEVDNDLVPDRWKGLFTNEEWMMHDIVVKSTYGFLVIAIIAHTLCYIWEPWVTP
ncbi:MAG: light-harvesting protein [Chloroflexi bacterium]|nr:light-harvesting protein [Chloroflexota bacterium]